MRTPQLRNSTRKISLLGLISFGVLLLTSTLVFSQHQKARNFFKFKSPQINADILGSLQNLDATLVLTRVPRGMFLEGDDQDASEVRWTPDVPCVLRYSTRPSNRVLENYPNQFDAEGAGRIVINPAAEGVGAGTFYCILVSKDDPTVTSVEFTIIVQADSSPIAKAPLGTVNLQQGTPLFQWDRVGGVPYYFLFLSEGPIAIERNDDGEITGLTGLNLTWQVITTANFVKYGDPDPSGSFINAHVPPLLTGVRYNWIVLNAYGPSTDMVSGEVAPLAPAFFEVNRPTLSQTPTLIEPATDAVVSDEEIIFRWNAVNGATRYRLFLYLTAELSGNEIDFTFWSQVTTENQIRLPAHNLLIRSDIHWRVVAENASGISASERRRFEYAGSAGWAKFTVNSEEGPVSRALVEIITAADADIPVPALTDTFGVIKVPLPSGAYTYRVSRSGFVTTPLAPFSVPNNDTALVDVEIARGASTISGQVVDGAGAGLFDAAIEFKSGNFSETVRSNSAGYFSTTLNPGSWSFQVYKERFVARPPESFTLQAEETKDLGELSLQEASNRVNGQVIFAADSRPLQGAFVRAKQNDITFETTTNNTGGFTFTLGPGIWNISLDALGFVTNPPNYTFQFTENGQVSAPFQLVTGGIVYGRVLFDGHGLEDAVINALRKDNGTIVQTSTSGALGDYSIGLQAGSYDLVVSRPGYLEERREVTITAGQTLVEDFTLTEAGFVEGLVISLETTQPVEGAKVFVVEDTTRHTFSDAEGNYSLSLPPNTQLQIDAALSGFDSNGPFTIVATSGEAVRQDFFLKALSGVIRGQVTDGFAPIAGALVEIIELDVQASTDNDGRFDFTIPPGEYNLKVSKDCHFSKFISVNLVAGISEDLEIVLEELQSIITGRVVDSGGRAIAGAQVLASGDTVFTAFTNSSGDYQLCLNDGIFRITASQLGYLSSSRTLVINEGDSLGGIDFTLQSNFARIFGSVADTLDQAVASAVVTLTNANQMLIDTTDESGEFVIENIIPGLSEIVASKETFYGIHTERFLNGRQELSLDLTLYPADGFISGTVRDSQTQEGIAGVSVSAEFAVDSEAFFSSTTDAGGNYRIENLPVISGNTFTVFAFKEGYFSAMPIADIVAKSTDVDFDLVNRTGSIKGEVIDRDTGDPIANARVEATNSSGARRQSFSNIEGKFTIAGLVPASVYNVSAAKSGFFTELEPGVEAGDTTVVLDMLRRYGFVSGHVVDIGSGSPMPNVSVVATPVGSDGRESTTMTNTSGEYTLKLIADFYAVQPALSHHRNEPREQQVEVTEVDTVSGIDFGLEPQQVQAISVSRADQSPDPEIANTDSIRFSANASDFSGRPVNIGSPIWSLDVSRLAATIDNSGLLKFNRTFFGDINITATDPVSQKKGALTVRVFAPIDSNTNVSLFNDRGLRIVIEPNSVETGQRLMVSKEAMAPAKRGRAALFSTDSSYVIRDATLVFSNPVKLILPSPPNSSDLERFIGRWDVVENLWVRIENSDVNPNNQVEAEITLAGEYTALAMARALSVENMTALPNPFSPHQEIDGRMGLRIQFDISSNAAPNPLLSVKIYNLEGNLVRLLHDQTPFQRGPTVIYWDGTSDGGALARNGRYILRVILEDPTGSTDVMKSVILIK
jgi:hypothetical protein